MGIYTDMDVYVELSGPNCPNQFPSYDHCIVYIYIGMHKGEEGMVEWTIPEHHRISS